MPSLGEGKGRSAPRVSGQGGHASAREELTLGPLTGRLRPSRGVGCPRPAWQAELEKKVPRTPRGEGRGTTRVRAAFSGRALRPQTPGGPACLLGYQKGTDKPTPGPPTTESGEPAGGAVSGAPHAGRWAMSQVMYHEVTRGSRGNEGPFIHMSEHPYCAPSKPKLAARPGRGLGDRRTFLAGWSPWMLLMPGGPAGCMWAPTGRCCGC